MKKWLTGFVVCVLALGLVACKDTTQSGGEKEKTPEYKELTDPRGTTLESTATGEIEPQMVDTLYETVDVVIAEIVPTEMGYAVDPTGKTDSTVGIQQALNDCYNAGGGTVFLPAGNYAISDTIYIPAFVTLRGDWQDPDEGTEYGTIISVWMESEDREVAGAFQMGSSAGAMGLTIYYPLQTLENVMPYSYAFFVEGSRPNNSLATIKNITIINGYRGIGTNAEVSHEMLMVDNVKGTYLFCGMDAANSADTGTVKNFVVNNKYWKEAAADCMNAVAGDAIDAYTKKYTTGIEVGDLEWTGFNNILIDGCSVGVRTVPGVRIDFAGNFYDMHITNCKQGFVVDGLDDRWGLVIARSSIEGGVINNTEGKVKLCDVEVVGEITEKFEGTIVQDDSDLSEFPIDYTKGYTKPKENVVIGNIEKGIYTDSAPDIQALLDEVSSAGGGVLYMPGGTYRLKSPLTVPANVELRGNSSIITRDQPQMNGGTVFLCYYGDDATDGKDGQAFITLAGENAGVNGLRVVYPENGPYDEDLNSTYTIRGKAKGVYVVNTMISASAYGIDFTGCDNHYIDGVITCCYYNAFRLGGTGGIITRCHQNATVITRTKTASLENWLKEGDQKGILLDPVLRKKSELVIVEDAKDQLIYSVFSYGVKSYLKNVNSENTIAVNIGSDNIGTNDPQLYLVSGDVTAINILRDNGYSYEIESGNMALYNRIAIDEAGEETRVLSK